MLQHAFKEWAVVCAALASGRQSLILRKGGIAETAGAFAVEQDRFWLYPTFTHQQTSGIQADAMPLLEQAQASRPPAGMVRLQNWAEVERAYCIRDPLSLPLLAHLHVWSEDTLAQRFHYRMPGLFLLVVRVHQTAQAHEIVEQGHYAGCKSWVELAAHLSTVDSTPVLNDANFKLVHEQLERLLMPTALA